MNTRGEREERGASAVEYGLMVALVAALLVGSLHLLGVALESSMDCTGYHIDTGMDCPAP